MSRLGVALFLLLSACGEVKGTSTDGGNGSADAPGAGDFSLTVDMASLTIPIAGSADVTVTVERSGEVGDITLSASGLGSNLEVAFSPSVIPEGETTSTATISVKGATPPGTSMVTLTGTAGDKTHSADVSVTTTTITVSGTVRGNRAGVKVGIIGKQSVTSGAGGVFTFTDVTPPYDLYTFADDGCGTPVPTVYYFDDLTRPDPIVTAATFTSTCTFNVFCGIPPFTCPASSVSGTKSGQGNNSDPVVWAWSEGSFNSPMLNPDGTFSGTASWGSGNTSSGALHALQLTRKPNGAPNAFLGYARATKTLTSGQSATISLNFGTVNSTATVTGTLNGPAGYPTPTVRLLQQFENTQQALWQAETTAIDAAFPLIAAAGGNSLYAYTSLDGGFSYYVKPLTTTATVDFTIPEAAVITAPADAATGVTTQTMFSWTAPTSVISEVLMSATSTQGTAKATFHIYTTSDQLTIPVIPELALPSGQSYSWRVYGYGPNTSIDDAAAANELEAVSSADYAGPEHAYTLSATRTFTTQ